MNQPNAEMPEPSVPKTPHGVEEQPAASTGTETAPGVQRALQFENEETPGPEESDSRKETAESESEPRVDSAPETSPEATSEASEPFILPRERALSDGSTRHVRHLAVALDGITCPRDAEEQKRAAEAATAWHHDLLGLLSQWPSGVTFRLRFQVPLAQDKNLQRNEDSRREGASRLGVSLIVTVEARSAETAEARAGQIAGELRRFLQGGEEALGRVYEVRPVTSEKSLRQRLVPFQEGEGLRLSRRTVPLRSQGRSGMGFGAGPRDRGTDEVPAAVGPPAMERPLSSLLQAMLGQGVPSLLDVRLCPTSLQPGELSRLRSLARGEATSGTALSGREEEAIVAFSEDLIEQAGHCFEVEVTLAQRRAPVSPAPVSPGLQAAAGQALFGEAGSPRAREVPLEQSGGLLRPAGGNSAAGREPDPRNGRPGAENGTPGSAGAGTDSYSGRLCRLYSKDEAARLFRFPAPTPEALPGVRAVHPASRHVPSGLSDEGPLLGETTAERGLGKRRKEVRLHPEDMFHHVYVLGQTGTGKTTMLGSMMMERIEAGAGVGLIDPHGDLYDRVRAAVPAGRREDVILFDPASEADDTKLNLLEYDPEHPRQRSRLINELLQILDQEYDLKETGGPIFERYMRNALLLVMDDPKNPRTLLDVVRLFQDRTYREALLESCDNERAVRFWQEAENTPTTGELPSPENMSIYVTSKLSRFLDDDYLRSLVSQRRSTIDFREVIDEGKILLVKMAKGTLGQLGIRMFGTIVVARLLMAALSREKIPESERRGFFLFVDEFQNFTTPTIASLLSEARKYRLSLTLANQTLCQLDGEIADAVLGNAGSLVSLRPGVRDYEQVEPYVSPFFRREDLVNLPNYRAVGRVLVGGEPTRPFLFETTPRLGKRTSGGPAVEETCR